MLYHRQILQTYLKKQQGESRAWWRAGAEAEKAGRCGTLSPGMGCSSSRETLAHAPPTREPAPSGSAFRGTSTGRRGLETLHFGRMGGRGRGREGGLLPLTPQTQHAAGLQTPPQGQQLLQEQPPKGSVMARFHPRTLRLEAKLGGGGDKPGTGPRSHRLQPAPSQTPGPEAPPRAPWSAGW